MPLAIVLVSGGLDSCVVAATAALDHDLAFLHLSYGQRTQERERQAFAAIADHYQVEQRLAVDVSYMQQIGGSSLIDRDLPVPVEHEDTASIPTTYVPFRNANILGIGVAWAETIAARDVFIGAHEIGAAYPDCRQVFFAAYNQMVAAGTRPNHPIQVQTPLIDLDKTAIVRRGLELRAPLHLTWSCYQNQEKACGRCHSCQLRLQGFRAAGLEDPVTYEE
jgi:7-cyano-7-deazaguanine synthase